MKDAIDIGDPVYVRTDGYSYNGVVKYMPQATGDSWIIRETRFDGQETGALHYVQTFIEIIRQDAA